MNCAECRDNFAARAEGLLGREESVECEAHLETCTNCRMEFDAMALLQQRLADRGQAAAAAAPMVHAVMRRVLGEEKQPERDSIMSRLFTRWGWGLSAATGAAMVTLLLLLASPGAKLSASEIMARGAQAIAKLNSIHIRGKLRTLPNDNFGSIDASQPFHSIELWKQAAPELKWRVEKPGRVAVMDGQSTLLYIKPANTAMKVPQPSPSAFDTEWLHRMADLSATIESELKNAVAKGWKLSLTEERAADGRRKSIVTIEAKSGLPDDDYLKNKFFFNSDTRRVYRFDEETELLEGVEVYLAGESGDTLIFELQQIDYNQAMDPALFQLELPQDVSWYQLEMEMLPDNEKYASLTAEQAARAYFEALARQDWKEAEKFRRDSVPENIRQSVGGLEIVSLGQAFATLGYYTDGRFVPYEIKLKSGDVVKHNLALKKDKKTGRWFVDGGGF